MPKIVNKEEKRKEIANSCKDLLLDVGIKKMTVSQVAQCAGIGKGTVYEYFKNKDDIIFEIINMYIEHHNKELLEKMDKITSTRERLFLFFDFIISDTLINRKHFAGYKEYLSVVLSEEKKEMEEFNTSCYNFFKNQLNEIIKEGVDKKELKKEAINFVDNIICFERGVVILKMTQANFDGKKVCEDFINNLFDMLEIKKGK